MALARNFSIRLPAEDLIDRYRKAGLWREETLTQMLDEGLLANPAQTFRIWSSERPYQGTFADLRQSSLKLAAGLQSIGVKPGDIVSFQLPNWIEAVEAFMATMYVGAVSLPIVQIYGAKEMKFVLAQTEAKVHITTHRFRHLDYQAMMDEMKGDLPALERILYIDDDFPALKAHEPLTGPVAVSPDSPAVLGYTSGTTADPKGVIHTQRTYVAEMLQRMQVEPGDERPLPLKPPAGSENWLIGSPIGHVSGLQSGLFVPILFNTPANIMDRWEIDVVLKTLVEEKLSLGAAANFFFNSVINHPDFDAAVHVPRMSHILSGGAPVPRAFGEQCNDMGISLVRGYGSTEHPSISGSAFTDPLDKRIGTDGRALTCVDIQIRDSDGNLLPNGEPGEIFSRGPDLFVGYVDERLNDAIGDDGWFCTGDIGILDDEGYLTITDRAKDIIIRGGENVSAAEVEDALLRMSAISECAAVAAPDARLGEHVCAFLKLKPGATAPTMKEMQAHLAEFGLARQKWPEDIRVIDEFDRTPAGKVKKFVLRDMLRREALDAAE